MGSFGAIQILQPVSSPLVENERHRPTRNKPMRMMNVKRLLDLGLRKRRRRNGKE